MPMPVLMSMSINVCMSAKGNWNSELELECIKSRAGECHGRCSPDLTVVWEADPVKKLQPTPGFVYFELDF